MKKVRSLQRGSTLAIVSPSWGGPASFPQVYKLGIDRLQEEFGFHIKEYPTTRGDTEHNHAHPEERARPYYSFFMILNFLTTPKIRLLKLYEVSQKRWMSPLIS